MVNNKRNTRKEKIRENRGFPYRTRINKQKWKVTDDDGKVYGKFRLKVNARKEMNKLNKLLFRDDLGIEEI